MKKSEYTINLQYVHPPIPDRDYDWCATLDGYDMGDPIGQGMYPTEAIADLLEQVEEKEDEE